jgi:hypothetical protein
MFAKKLTTKSLFIGLFILVDILLLGWWILGNQKISTAKTPINDYPEIQQLQSNNMNFDQLKTYFTDLAQKKGAEYAYYVLKVADMPPNTDMHLMGHVVGDVLYDQQGMDGIKVCTRDFRNACSHSIVVGLLLEKGEEVLPEIAEACKQAPGGKGAYTMCYHGLGHGVLAYTAYNLPKTVELCQKTGQAESNECIGGSIMEIISGGDHDKALWAKERPKYLKADDPFYSCLAPFMPESAKPLCLTYLTPYLWEAVGANIGSPTDEDFKKSFALCRQLENKNYRDICYGGFGKEFTALAQARDIRKIEDMTEQQLLKTYRWCELAVDKEGIWSCAHNTLSSLFWGGENDVAVSIRYCNIITDTDNKNRCFSNLITQVKSYVDDKNYKQTFCQKLPPVFQSDCQSQLLAN